MNEVVHALMDYDKSLLERIWRKRGSSQKQAKRLRKAVDAKIENVESTGRGFQRSEVFEARVWACDVEDHYAELTGSDVADAAHIVFRQAILKFDLKVEMSIRLCKTDAPLYFDFINEVHEWRQARTKKINE